MQPRRNLTYLKGPLGYAVLLDGKPVGRISDRRNLGNPLAAWQVSVPWLSATTATAGGKLHQGTTVFPTIAAAKMAVRYGETQ